MGDLSRCVDRGSDGKSFVTRHIAGETIVVPVTGTVADLNAVYTLNDVGSFIWHVIDGRRSAQEIAEAVSAEYDVTLEQAAQDVDELLTVLETTGLARLSAEPGRDA